MASKTIKISEDNYRWLLTLAAELQIKECRPISLDEALNNIKNKKEKR